MAMVLVEGGDQLPSLVGEYNGTTDGSGASALMGTSCRRVVMVAVIVGFIMPWY